MEPRSPSKTSLARGAASQGPTPSPGGSGGGKNNESSAPAARGQQYEASGGASGTQLPKLPMLREIDNANTAKPSANNNVNVLDNAGRAVMAWAPPAPLQTLSEEELGETLRRNKFCIGVKRGGEYRCGGEAGEDAKSRAVDLLVEAVGRILKWRVWDVWWVEEWMDEWLETRDRLELQLRGKYVDEVVNAITGLVDEFINYNEQLWKYWQDKASNDIKRIINDLLNGKTEVIIWNDEKGISVHGRHVTLNVNKLSDNNLIVQLILEDLKGTTIKVPDVFKPTMKEKEYVKFINELLKALREGFAETDGFKDDDKAAMGTTQIWQVIIWTLLHPGEIHTYINLISINKSNVTIGWRMKSKEHSAPEGLFLNNADKLNREMLLTFMFAALLGDGAANIYNIRNNGRTHNIAIIVITMANKKFDMWRPLLERLKKMGFTWSKTRSSSNNVISIWFSSGNAIDLARSMIAILPPILKDLLDALSFEKWLNLRRITEIEVKYRRGESQIEIAGYKFTVSVQESTVELVRPVKDEIKAKAVIDALRAKYGIEFVKYMRINKSSKYLAVTIPMYVFERYDDIKVQVIEVLCRKFKKAKNDKKKQTIIKHVKRLMQEKAPTKGAAAAKTVP